MEKLLVEFGRHANRDRFDLHFLSLGPRGVIADELEDMGWPVTALDVTDGIVPSLLPRLASQFWRLHAGVVHTHNTRPLLYAGPAARLAGVGRVIHTRHGQRYGASWGETTAFRVITRTVDRVVCVSHDSAALTRKEGVAPARIETLLNGIDPTRFRPADPAGSGPIVAVGRLSPEKDFATLVRAAAVAARRDPTFRLDIAGDGACREELRALIEELGADPSVRLLGQVRDIPGLLASAAAFTLASLTEGISLTILEAMAAGLPVVATRVGGNPEVVVDGQTGLLVPAADPDRLADALLAVWRDPARRRTMGRAGRARVEAAFDVRRMVAAYESLYLERPVPAAPPSSNVG